MTQYAVLTAIGPDKPGLVDAISRFILDHQCNIEDSQMGVLGGEFAMLILVSGQETTVRAVLESAAAAGEQVGLTVQGRITQLPGEEAVESLPYTLSAFAMDHPGIVQKVAHFLSSFAVNVRALETRTDNAPVSGQPLFALHAIIDIPATVKIAEVRRGLEELGDEQNIDIELKPEG